MIALLFRLALKREKHENASSIVYSVYKHILSLLLDSKCSGERIRNLIRDRNTYPACEHTAYLDAFQLADHLQQEPK